MSTIASEPALRHMSDSWRPRLLRELDARQPRLAAASELFLLAAIPVVLAALLDTRQVNDVNIWLKPLKFLMSLGIYYGTLAWLHGYLPEEARRTRRVRVLVGLAIVVGLLEMTWLIATAIVGEPSHFNQSAPIYAVSYSLAGLGATMLMLVVLATGIMIGRAERPALPPAFRLSIVVGCTLAFIGTMVTAGYLASGTGHWVGESVSDAGGLPLVGWSRSVGDLRVAHFFSIHAFQAVPFVGWVVTRSGVERQRTAVWVFAALYAGWITFTFVEALLGRPLV